MHTTDLRHHDAQTAQEQNQKAVAGFAVWAIAFITAAVSNIFTQPFFDMIVPDGGLAFCLALVCDGFVALIMIAGLSSIGANSRVNAFGERVKPYLMKKLW